jgi:glutamate 5-kinase
MKTKRLVVKVGTGFLFDKLKNNMCKLRPSQISGLVEEIAKISENREIVLVSSGAIATAAWKFKIPVPTDHYERARLSGIGQPYLMGLYQKEFGKYGKRVSQFLVCSDDLKNPKSKKNLIKNQEAYFREGIIGIYNENDLIAIDEITFGDNDILAAHLACCLNADLLVMLSDPREGLGTGGGKSKQEAAKILKTKGICMKILNGKYIAHNGEYLPKITDIL